jgi:hypothetical protein
MQALESNMKKQKKAQEKILMRLGQTSLTSEDIMKTYEKIGADIGKLVQEKNEAYGDSFGQACKILEVLYPNGVTPDQYRDALAVTRVIDKLFRLANKKDAFGESPWRDICGYAILGVANDESEKSDDKQKERENV